MLKVCAPEPSFWSLAQDLPSENSNKLVAIQTCQWRVPVLWASLRCSLSRDVRSPSSSFEMCSSFANPGNARVSDEWKISFTFFLSLLPKLTCGILAKERDSQSGPQSFIIWYDPHHFWNQPQGQKVLDNLVEGLFPQQPHIGSYLACQTSRDCLPCRVLQI